MQAAREDISLDIGLTQQGDVSGGVYVSEDPAVYTCHGASEFSNDYPCFSHNDRG